MDYVCVKMNDPVARPLDSYLQRLVIVGSSSPTVACRRAASFPLSSEGLVKSSSLIGRSRSDPNDIHAHGISHIINNVPEEKIVTTSTTDNHVCRLSAVRPRKKVTFADDRGCQLVHVIIMTEPSDEPPRINPSVLQALGVCDNDWSSESAHAACTWRIEFPQPASDYSEFRTKVQRQNVAVENVLVDNEHQQVSGIIKVKNTCFEKTVFVRYSADNWRTYYDRPARFLRSASADFDSFHFDFALPADDGQCCKLEFCVCFKDAQGVECWDNNDGRNFELSSESLRKSRAEDGGNHQASARSSRQGDPSCADAFLLDHHNWTEFTSWTDLPNDAPFW